MTMIDVSEVTHGHDFATVWLAMRMLSAFTLEQDGCYVLWDCFDEGLIEGDALRTATLDRLWNADMDEDADALNALYLEQDAYEHDRIMHRLNTRIDSAMCIYAGEWDLVLLGLKAEVNDAPGAHRRYWDTVFNLYPSGKYYTPWANSNVNEVEVLLDELWRAELDEWASRCNVYITGGEGDPCDLFMGWVREIDEAEFLELTGREPINDDIYRVNCPEAGEFGHSDCGWCIRHNGPVYQCGCKDRGY